MDAMTLDRNDRSARIRTAATWAVTTFSAALAVVFVFVLVNNPSLPSAWFGMVCFVVATLGGATTIYLDRANRKR